ncbi:hypothetical protein RDI61_17835 [Pseudomonas plecoglossicida]|uniref:hypothetical protein n=1 Tax=Pseudomonas putida group TaxID=136845 RepID=UPI0024105F0F|nr:MULTISPECIES: hypothetical protein [Pseudomonas putida group]MDQ7965889.1 hypothetical protein [Pseudomonas plecoglossicida]WFG01109.1 hypothetical protein P3X84_18465 [Pseudomonas putida]
MGRERVSKGQIILKKDEKVIAVLQDLSPDASDEDFFKAFQEKYPADLDRVQKRYDEHERVNKGKEHPMARPYQYILNAAKKTRDQYRKGGDLAEMLVEVTTKKPKFVEGCPPDIQRMIAKASDMSSYETRIDGVNLLGKWKCDEVISALNDRLVSDPVYDVRDTAYERLKRFGLTVKKPSKDKPHVDPDIQNKLVAVAAELKPGFAQEKFERKFKTMFPAEFDLEKYHRRNQFKYWLKKFIANMPKDVAPVQES